MTKLMFEFVDETANPLGGDCYGCPYCYIHGAKGMKNRFPHLRKKYSGDFRLYEKVLDKVFKDDRVVFFCDCIDWLHPNNSDENCYRIIEWVERSPKTTFLSLTKNPKRYLDLRDELPLNMVLGATIETNIIAYSRLMVYKEHPPHNSERLHYMREVKNNLALITHKRFLGIEPILSFEILNFVQWIEAIDPTFGIAVGYDNHNHNLSEPALSKTMELIKLLELNGFKVYRKTLRKAWWET